MQISTIFQKIQTIYILENLFKLFQKLYVIWVIFYTKYCKFYDISGPQPVACINSEL